LGSIAQIQNNALNITKTFMYDFNWYPNIKKIASKKIVSTKIASKKIVSTKIVSTKIVSKRIVKKKIVSKNCVFPFFFYT